MRPTECCYESSTIRDRITRAEGLFDLWKDAMTRNPEIRGLCAELEGRLAESRIAMANLGIVEACRRCDEKEVGSCCAAGLENKFDSYLLLVNLLLGIRLPASHLRPESCYFLSDTGCTLKARLVLCVDFLCDELLLSLRREDLLTLQRISGEELAAAFRLCDAVKRFVRRAVPARP